MVVLLFGIFLLGNEALCFGGDVGVAYVYFVDDTHCSYGASEVQIFNGLATDMYVNQADYFIF